MRDREPIRVKPVPIEALYPPQSQQDLNDRAEVLKEDDLRPYDDDEFLLQRLEGTNRLLRRVPELQGQITDALHATDDESLLALVETIEAERQRVAPQQEKPINRVLSFLTLAAAVRRQMTDANAKNRGNAFMRLTSKKIADSFQEKQLLTADLSAMFLHRRFKALDEVDNSWEPGKVYACKVITEMLMHDARRRRLFYEYIEKFPKSRESERITHDEALRDSQVTAEFFAEMRASQRFGMKMGYIADARGGTLILKPPVPLEARELASQSNAHPLLAKVNAIAGIVHSRKKSHDRIKHEIIQEGNNLAFDSTHLDPIVDLSLDENGELCSDIDCRTTLRDIAVEKGNYRAYRNFQATILAHYFDMTHSVDEIMRIKQKMQTLAPFTSDNPNLAAFMQLVVPRIRYITEGEDTNDTDDDQDREPGYHVRRHDVVWHIRQLPEGWSASPDAIELAKSLGVQLKEGETVVREHKRGSRLLGEVGAHQIVTIRRQRS